MNPRKVWLPGWIIVGVVLTGFVSSPFSSLPLVADEEWMVFEEYGRIYGDVRGLIDFLVGWAQTEPWLFGRLRLLYPGTEFFGLLATAGIGQLTGLDPMLAYGLWRVLANVIAFLGFSFLLLVLLRHVPAENQRSGLRTVALFFPALLIAPNAMNAYRVFPSHYAMMAASGAVLFALVWLVLEKAERSSNRIWPLVLCGLAGVVLVVGSEFFYAIGFAVFAAKTPSLVFRHRVWNGQKVPPLPSLVFGGTFLLSFAAVRIWLAELCAASSSCYSRTALAVDGQIVPESLFHFLGLIPPVQHVIYLLSAAPEVRLGVLALGAAAMGVASLASRRRKLDVFNYDQRRQPGFGANAIPEASAALALGGLAWSYVTVLGFSATKAFSSDSFGKSSLEIAQVNNGLLLALVAALLALHGQSSHLANGDSLFGLHWGTLRRMVSGAIATIMLSTAFFANATSAETARKTEEFMIQREISIRVSQPSSSLNSDASRCLVLEKKLDQYSRWYGHDLAVVRGLNHRYEQSFQEPFCSHTEERLFSGYG